MRGRKPKPTAAKRAAGTLRRDRVNEAEPRFAPGRPQCPPHVTGEACQTWDRLCGELAACGLLTTADRELVAMLAVEWTRLVDAERGLAERGPIIPAPSGYPILNPWLSVVRQSTRVVLALLAELGLTPSARSRVKTVHGKEADEYFGD